MSQTATILLRDHVDDEWLLRVSCAMVQSPLHRAPCFIDDLLEDEQDEDEELALFRDYSTRAIGVGFFSHDEHERLSRRIDLRGPTDEDPGPLEMHEAPAKHDAIELEFDAA